jgi:hypothetical protein
MPNREAEISNYLKMDDDDLEQTLAIELGITNGIDVSAAVGDGERKKRMQAAVVNLRSKTASAISDAKVKLKKVACGQLRYCERRETAIEIVVIGLVDAAITEFSRIPLPTIAICVYIVKKRMLDPLCECVKLDELP